MFTELDKDKCCGCMACYTICPTKAIGIKSDALGFSYPYLASEDTCINCDKCKKVCVGRVQHDITTNIGNVYCACNNDLIKRRNSSSGGLFPAFCSHIIN